MYKTVWLSLGLAAWLGCSSPETPSALRDTAVGGAPQTAKEEQKMGAFIHSVFFWLNEDVDESGKQQLIEDCRNLLGPISTVTFFAVGPPAGTPREVVDNSYDVGLVVHFEDEAGHDFYQNAEAHLEFIERNREKWKRVQVYDIYAD